MLKTMLFGVGQRDGKWHAYCDADDFPRMLGPARDTEEEARVDQAEAQKLGMQAMRKVGLDPHVAPVQ